MITFNVPVYSIEEKRPKVFEKIVGYWSGEWHIAVLNSYESWTLLDVGAGGFESKYDPTHWIQLPEID